MISRRFFMLPMIPHWRGRAQAPVARTSPAAEVAANPPSLTLQLSNGGTGDDVLRPDLALCTSRGSSCSRPWFTRFDLHRVIPLHAQGATQGNGEGGSELSDIKPSHDHRPSSRNSGAARASNPNSGNSQFVIMFAPARAGQDYTVVGRVISGMDAVDKIAPATTAARRRL